ncbi:MAG TPA: hypothetical protein VGR20_03790 [Acidimicrobiia bacterium]|jgi:hypothetical protein|nr:hypothetical protein [Acidimicrobiia bacterium]
MAHRLPSHDELVDLSWLLDSALVVGDRDQAIELASRLLESLLRHQQGMTGRDLEAGSTTVARQHACIILSADVASVLNRLRRGDLRRTEFRHRVEALAEGRDVRKAGGVQPSGSRLKRG